MAAEKGELRQLVPSSLLSALDAIAMAKGIERHVYVESILTAEAKKVAHEATVISRCLAGNPLLPESGGVRG